jgi:hypothetical protein
MAAIWSVNPEAVETRGALLRYLNPRGKSRIQ